MRVIHCSILLAIATIAACKQDAASIREREFCTAHPTVCTNGQLVAQKVPPLTVDVSHFQLPDLIVRSVSCDATLDGRVMMSGHIANLGPVPTPGGTAVTDQVYVSATVNPDGRGDQTFVANGIGLAAAGSRDDNYNAPVDVIPGASSQSLTSTLFKITVNPPIPRQFPGGKIWESNAQNNVNCGVCNCDSTGCHTIQTPSCSVL